MSNVFTAWIYCIRWALYQAKICNLLVFHMNYTRGHHCDFTIVWDYFCNHNFFNTQHYYSNLWTADEICLESRRNLNFSNNNVVSVCLGFKAFWCCPTAAVNSWFELQARYAQEAGADSILTLPDLFYKADSVEGLIRYINDVSRAAPRLPVLYYHFPNRTGVWCK